MDLISKQGGKSIVWLFFGFKGDENGRPLNRDEAICRLCRKIVVAKGNTTNLRSHLRRQHPADFYESIASTTPGALSESQGVDLNHEELLEDVPCLQSPSNSNYVPDAVVPPGEPWLHRGPSRAVLSLPSCLCLCGDGGFVIAGSGSSGEEHGEKKVYAKCQLQQGVLFGPFVGEVCKGHMPNNLKYAWAIRDDAAFVFVDASDENKSNWMRYVTYTSREEEHNLVVFQFYRHIYYRVSQPISEGAELKVLIGKEYASLLGLGMSESIKCEIGDKETALRLLQDIQLVTLPEMSTTSFWSDHSQSQSPMPVITDVSTVSHPEAAPDPGVISASIPPSLLSQSSIMEKYDFMPGAEKLLSNPVTPQNSPWNFFGLEPDPTGRPLDRSTAVCKLCMEHVSCGGGAADLQSHLTSKHHIKPRDINKDRSQTTAQQHAQQRVQPVTPISAPVSSPHLLMPAQLTRAITNFIVVDLQPAALVEGQGFRQLLHTLLPSHRELPLPCQVEGLLRDHHTKGKQSLAKLLGAKTGSVENEEISDYTAPIEFEPRRRGRPLNHQGEVPYFVNLSVDVWLHSWPGNTERYLTLWAHYIDEHFSLHNLALATQRQTESEGNDYDLQAVEAQVKIMAQEWGIFQPNLVLWGVEGKSRTRLRPIKSEVGVEATGSAPHPNSTTFLERDDSASSEETHAADGRVGEGLPSVPCFFSAVQGCIEEVMSHPVISKTLSQFQGILSTLFLPSAQDRGLYEHYVQKLSQGLTKQDKMRLKSWAHSRPTWNSLYPVLSTLTKNKSVLCDIIKEIKDESCTREKAASELTSSGSLHANSTSSSTSTSLPTFRAEWKVVEELCLVLKPLDVACRTLAKEAFPRLSLIKPILTGLLSRHLVLRPGDSSSILKEVKRMMRRNLARCYDNPAVNRALSVACSLDPQFHGLGFMEEKEQTATFNWLKKEAVRIVKEDRRRSQAKTQSQVKRSSSLESADSESDFVRRSKRLKECPPINFKELADADEDDVCDAGVAYECESMESGSQAGLSGMEFLLGDLFSSTPRSTQSSVEESVDIEMSVFRADKGASLGVEPLQWWRTKAVQFPLLASVARAYLAAPAVAGNAAQDFVQEGARTANGRRSNISPESLDAILFLHHNHISPAESGQAAAKSDDKN
ncbi:E3 SUMO-protein ligase ZBED1-like isoform 2-T2 [Odontesthes bonariensis]|uniref:E3 SUMO-protein ligase ZBED1-like isoform X2 n=1 Tax=Odontesthes bonariensis TaxID=219752 RepID=UPI003F58D93A